MSFEGNPDARCIYCQKYSGLQLICADCWPRYLNGELPSLESTLRMRIEEAKAAMPRPIPPAEREPGMLQLFTCGVILGLLWWLFCVIWLGSAP